MEPIIRLSAWFENRHTRRCVYLKIWNSECLNTMKILRILIFFTISFSACAIPNESRGFLRYSTDNYRLQYPDNWIMDTSKDKGVEFVIRSPKENEEDKFCENVNLIIQDLKGQNTDLERIALINEAEIKAKAKDLKKFAMTKVESGSKVYEKLTYEMTFGDFWVFTEQYYFVKDEKAYVITFSSEINKSNTVGEGILDSFTLAD